jgi:hypothetical protein
LKRQDEFEQIALPLGSLLRVARRLTLESAAAEDLVEDSMLLSWLGFHQFQGTNARAWLFRILFHCFYGAGQEVAEDPDGRLGSNAGSHSPGARRGPGD